MSGHPTTFLTLTVSRKANPDKDIAARALVRAWRLVRQRARKKYGYKTIPFLAIFEATKHGHPHLHILARVRWLDQKWLSDQMNDLLKSPVVDIRRVNSQRGAARYVTKYLSKAPHQFATLKRYWRSLDFKLDPEEEKDAIQSQPYELEIVRTAYDDYITQARESGLQVTIIEGGAWISGPVRTRRRERPP
jgi:hypothetical protein